MSSLFAPALVLDAIRTPFVDALTTNSPSMR
jgi:hypothetical protein